MHNANHAPSSFRSFRETRPVLRNRQLHLPDRRLFAATAAISGDDTFVREQRPVLGTKKVNRGRIIKHGGKQRDGSAAEAFKPPEAAVAATVADGRHRAGGQHRHAQGSGVGRGAGRLRARRRLQARG